MDSLRLILMLVGAVIIVAVYLHSRLKKGSNQQFLDNRPVYDPSKQSSATGSNTAKTPRDSDTGVIVDPSVYSFESGKADQDSLLEDELSELGSLIKIDASDSVSGDHYQDKPSTKDSFSESEAGQNQGGKKKGGLVEKVMVIYLLAQPDQKFSGVDIQNIAESEGLQFGADSYFHRYSNTDEKTGSIFGIANILEPGLFDSLDNEEFSTPGLVFFQQLTNAGYALEAFDDMLKSVIQFKEQLDGRLQDSGRRPLNKSAMIKLRDQVIAFSPKKRVSPF